jgi:hypothetical protein
MGTNPLPCPFCGVLPTVLPHFDDVKSGKEGGAWGEVACQNRECPALPTVSDGEDVSDSRGSEQYKEIAILRWNTRHQMIKEQSK